MVWKIVEEVWLDEEFKTKRQADWFALKMNLPVSEGHDYRIVKV